MECLIFVASLAVHFLLLETMSDTPHTTPQKSDSVRKRWQARAGSEARKLGNAEVGWNLAAGSIASRSLGSVRRSTGRLKVTSTPIDASDDMSSLTDDQSPKSSKPPPHTRVMLELAPLKRLLEDHLIMCPKCGVGKLVTFPTICVASSCRLNCNNTVSCLCGDVAAPALTLLNIPAAEDAAVAMFRDTDHALNVLHMRP